MNLFYDSGKTIDRKGNLIKKGIPYKKEETMEEMSKEKLIRIAKKNGYENSIIKKMTKQKLIESLKLGGKINE